MSSLATSASAIVPGNRRKERKMNAYLITYKASKWTQLKHTVTRFYPDYETACIESERVLAETFPKVVILDVELTTYPREETAQ